MAIMYSTKFAELTTNFCSPRQVMEGGKLDLWSGSPPSSADVARTGTKLCRVTLASGTITEEVQATAIITLTGGASGSVDSITIAGFNILGAAVSYATSLAVTAAAVAAQINKYAASSVIKVYATAAAEVITLTAVPGQGTRLNGSAIVCSCTTITNTINGGSADNMGEGAGGSTAGVAAVNGLTFGAEGDNVLTKTGVWSGVNLATGVAGYFTFEGPNADDEGATGSTYPRIQGTVGLPGSGADLILANTTLTSGLTHTQETFVATLPLS